MRIDTLLQDVQDEAVRTLQLLHLTANEPLMSDTARQFMASRIGDRYFMGGGDDRGVVDFGPFTFLGWPAAQRLIAEARTAACQMLGACEVSFNPLSGVHAMTCTLLSVTDPGDTVMSVHLDHGGHFATQLIIERTGRRHVTSSYNYDELTFDAAQIGQDFHEARARAFYIDASFYLRPHDLGALRAALGPDATIIYDASHTLGLIMGGVFQNPLGEGADVICGNTHKTLPGPQKGLIAFADSGLAERAGKIINNGLFSSAHSTSVLALAITILEMAEYGSAYASGVVANANALGRELIERGHRVRVARPDRVTENHQVHLLTENLGAYRDLYDRLIANCIAVNFDRSLGGEHYIRLGTQELTRRGMTAGDMATVAEFLSASLDGVDVRDSVLAFTDRFQNVEFSFDEPGGGPRALRGVFHGQP